MVRVFDPRRDTWRPARTAGANAAGRGRDLYYDLDEYEFAQLLEDLRKRIEDLESERQYLNKLASEQYYTIKELQEKLKQRRATWG